MKSPPSCLIPAKPEPPKVADEELAKHLMVDVQGTELNDADKGLLETFKPGLVVLRESNLQGKEQAQKLIAAIKAAEGGDGLDALKVQELKDLAADEGVDLGSATTKAPIIAAIRAHRADA